MDASQRRHRPPRDRAHAAARSPSASSTWPSSNGPTGGRRLGIVIGEKDLWGRGYGQLAAARAVDHAFHVLGLDRITAEVFADNPRSVRMFESLGFVREGVMRESIQRDGQRVDELIFGLLRHEWAGSGSDRDARR